MSRWMLVVSLAAACGGAGSRTAVGSASGGPGAGSDDDPRRVPDGYVRMEARDVVSVPEGGAVLLVDREGAKVLPIAIGGTEAVSIALRLHGLPSPRPLTHDLLDSVMRQLGGELVKVQVDRIVDGVFIGSIFIRTAGGTRRIDARPSDAIALAIGNRAPIYVARAVLDRSGIEPPGLDATQA
jgi:bifunctional DNase/RNase